MISVVMITYNHEMFISQAIEGVVMQRTTFPLELIIGDDSSSDRTLQICQEYKEKYPDIIKLKYELKNIGMQQNFYKTIQACSGKYIAFCEGDDYWTDPYKLQKQVDFLETNTNYALIHTNKAILRNGILYSDNEIQTKSGFIFEDLMFSPLICTLTVLVKVDIFKDSMARVSVLIEDRKWLMSDFPLWLDIAQNYQIAYLDEVTGVYRFLDESASHSGKREKAYLFEQSVISVKEYFYYEYKKSHRDLNFRFKLHFFEMIFHARKRLVLDYGCIAKNDFKSLILTNPFLLIYILFNKILRLLKK